MTEKTVFYLSNDQNDEGIPLLIEDTLTSGQYLNAGKGITTDNLVKVEIGTDVTGIGDSAFRNCKVLQSVTIPDSVKTIGTNAFRNCMELQSVTIGDGVTSIGPSAFDFCSALESLTIPDSVQTIGSYAFQSCTALKSVTIPDNVTSIGSYAFRACTELNSLTIGTNVQTIGPSAFEFCIALQSLTIRNGVQTIGNQAFQKCTALKSVTIPDSVTSIGNQAFQSCSKLRNLTIGDSVTSIGDSVMSIGTNAFRDCSALQSVTIGESVTSIGDEAFRNCTELKSLTIGTSVHTIGNYAFQSCTALKSLTIPDSVQTIGGSAFRECNALKSLTIGTSVQTIGGAAFRSCSKLPSLTIPDSVETIGPSAFEFCSALQLLTIGTSVYTIGNYAFQSCTALKSLTIPDSVQTIGGSAFRECNALKSLTIGTSVQTIGGAAFRSCSKLPSLTIPDSVETIGPSAFEFCSALQSLTIGTSVQTIGAEAFHDCIVLQSVTIPDSVTSIGKDAFEGSGIANIKMSVNKARKLYLIPNVRQGFFGATNVYVECPNTFVQPGIISGNKTGFDDWSNTNVKIALRYYKPTQRTFEQSREGLFIADLTKIAAIENVSITKIKWFKKTTNDDNYTEQTNYYNKRTYLYTLLDIVDNVLIKVQCTYSVNDNETTLESNPNLITEKAISNNYFEFEKLDNLTNLTNFTNPEFRKTLTMLQLGHAFTTISNTGLFENESFLYENMQEVEVPKTVTSIAGTPFPPLTRYYIRTINKYLNPNKFPWVNDTDKLLYFYLNETNNQLAKTKDKDGIKLVALSKSTIRIDTIWNMSVEINVPSNGYKDNKKIQISEISNDTSYYAYEYQIISIASSIWYRKIQPFDDKTSEVSTLPRKPGKLIFPNGILTRETNTFPPTNFPKEIDDERFSLERSSVTTTFKITSEVDYSEDYSEDYSKDFSKDFKRVLTISFSYGDQKVTQELIIKGYHWIDYEGEGGDFNNRYPYATQGRTAGYGQDRIKRYAEGCFPGNSKLILKDGTKKIFHDIQYGDEIQVCSKDMKLSYSKIVLMPHLRNNESREFIKLTTTSNQTIRATNNHYLPVLNKKDKLQNIMAYEITKDDKLYVLNNGQGMPEEIKSIEIIKEKGIYSCLVKEGEYIVVDNIVASPFYGYRDDFGYISKYIYSYNMTSIYAKGFAMLDNLGLMYIVAPLYRCTESLVTNLLKIFRK